MKPEYVEKLEILKNIIEKSIKDIKKNKLELVIENEVDENSQEVIKVIKMVK